MEDNMLGPGRPRRGRAPRPQISRRRPARSRPVARPALELLEPRVALSTLTVTSAADDGAGSLRAAIAAAQDGDTIQFAPRLKGQAILLTGGELAIAQDLTIQGPGAGRLDVDAGGRSRVFDITSASADVTISGLTISGGSAAQGAGLRVQGGTLTLTDDVIANNQAVGAAHGQAGQGGGVAVTRGGSLMADNTTFLDNLAQGGRGATALKSFYYGRGGPGQGGAIFDNGTLVTVTGGKFLQNRAVGGLGDAASGSSSFAYNGFGGDGSGGGIYVMRGALSVADSSFLDNQAQGGQGGDGGDNYKNGFGGDGAGGAIYGAGRGLDLRSDTFQANRAVGGHGGNWGAGQGYSTSSGERIDDNDYGGAGAGGGLYVSGGALTVVGGSFTDNQAVGGDGGFAAGVPFSKNGQGGDGSGGAAQLPVFSAHEAPISFDGVTFRANAAGGGRGIGGGADGSGDAGALGGGYFDQTLTIDGCRFDANLVHSASSGLFAMPGAAAIDTESPLVVLRSTFTGNQTANGVGNVLGGVISAENALTVGGSTFTGNRATGRFVNGGVLFAGGRLSVAASTFTGNQAVALRGADGEDYYGGVGGSIGGGVIQSDLFTITASTFASNRALAGDGGAGAPGAAGSPGGDILGGVISDTLALLNSISPGSVTSSIPNRLVIGCVFNGNEAIAGSGGTGGDGADGGPGGAVTGGDVYLQSQLSIADSRFARTVALGGRGGPGGSDGGNGGIGGAVRGGSLAIQNIFGTFSSDSAPSAFILGTSITGVQALGGVGGAGATGGAGGDARGGGLFVDGGSTVMLVGGSITGDTARGGDGGDGPVPGADGVGVGGGVSLSAAGSVRLLTRIAGNTASTGDDDVFGSFG